MRATALLPALGTTPEAGLRLADGKFGAGPPWPEPLSAQALGALVEAVGPVGDVAYFIGAPAGSSSPPARSRAWGPARSRCSRVATCATGCASVRWFPPTR